jgi:hypothetical protein
MEAIGMKAILRITNTAAKWLHHSPLRQSSFLLALSAALAGCGSLSRGEKDGLVTIHERLPLLPTGNDYEILEFRGKNYTHLFSHNYVFVPELDGIIFATRREGRHVKLHFVPKQGLGEITVDEGEVYDFGTDLGRPRDSRDTDYVESVANGRVTFFSTPGSSERYEGRTAGHRYVLDLRTRTFSRVPESSPADGGGKQSCK